MTPDDEAFDRLRAADPAAGTAPDMARITAAVAAATGLPMTAAGPVRTEAEVAAQPHDELAARRRRRTEWTRMAAAVAAVAVVGTAGYVGAGGLRGGSGTTSGVQALPAISLDGGATRDQASTGMAAQGAPANAAGGAAASGSAAMPMPGGLVGYGWRTVFTGQGLPTTAGSAQAWAFDASSVATAATAAHVAATLGVKGSPRTEWGSWAVGPGDGSGANLRLDGSGNLSYYDPSRDPWQCQGAGVSGSGATTGGAAVPPSAPNATGAAEPAPLPEATKAPRPANPSVCTTGTTPTGDAAIARARDALRSVGVDTTGTQVVVNDSNEKAAGSTGAAYVNVSFQQVVDGRLTGVSWGVTLVGDGVQSMNGTLATLVPLGTYPVISAAAAAERLNDPRFGAGGGVVPYAMGAASSGVASSASGVATPGAVATANPSQEPTVAPAPQPGAAIRWPVRHVTLVSAQLGVALTYQSDGAQALVPAYVLTDATGATWSVVAVADDHLDFASQ
ncbi:MAG: hypothetical protein BGO37_14590 [Cellulomonas sp. 73-92]|mgnify:CR=1 FL=1|uniref:hypothetical protein n=1 Tax=Cellulomonas sp. 73-92 TaxID=1895740 RepID=UPI0009275848|nr:hypothetical protein [Cellulomonas sp. 73-92]OJV80783.1 MAG: hypothetical protein BGO37_14590 [Cellulomonas sp. 73-92]